MTKKTLQITLPNFRWKPAYTLASFVAGTCLCLASGVIYWRQTIYPYYHLKYARLQAPSREMCAEDTGFIAETALSEGDLFQQGQHLFSLKEVSNLDQLKQVQEKMQACKVRISETKAKVDQTMEQYVYLQKELLGVESSEIMDEILAEAQSWQDKTVQIEQELAILDADYNALQAKLAKQVVKAPFDGVVLRRYMQPGEKIREGDAVLLVSANDMSIEAEVPETILSYLTLQQTAMISLPAFPGQQWQGQITWISPTVVDGKLKVRIKADNLPFKTGLTANVSLKIH